MDTVDLGGWVRMDEARKSSGIPRPLPLIRYRERGGSNGGAKLSPKMLPFGSNNSFIKPVSNLSAGKTRYKAKQSICKFGIYLASLLSVVLLVTGLPWGLINPVISRNYVDYTGNYCH